MEQLINLLFESPLLLFFIVAALLSFFQSGGKSDDRQGPGERRSPQPNDQGEKEIDWREIFRQEEAPPTTRKPSAERSQPKSPSMGDQEKPDLSNIETVNQELQDRYEEIRRKKEQAAKQAEKIGDSPIIAPDRPKKKRSNVDIDFHSISKNEVVKGVVWSEILERPKGQRNGSQAGYMRRR
ncbi:hypothetical protein [Texcoconibacillus texcoconensis]|uniref:Uncharacterized protein n=1 Tax=Texcoconibacillus texcoconensis TaxID=1095777 RepID=A0A840QRJ7_9BACI|nr:hypothetical protein [Texcoconibacillus texcoconensis]MBB5173941.1 hypothetical protein [Texcoconibacillus texcoconensis]